jgi:methionine synthase II (cobalamin-independent)
LSLKRDLEALHLATTDVGSLPLQDDFKPERTSLRKAIADKLSAGMDYPCCPQLLGTKEHPMNMNLQFLIPLADEHGLEIDGENIHQAGRVTKPKHPVGIEAPKFFTTWLRENRQLGRIKGPKACVTGPFTLAGYIDRSDILKCGASKPELVTTLAEIVADACKELERAGFVIINVDEPFLAVMLGRRILYGYNRDFIVKTLDSVIGGLRCYTGIHICGAVSPTIKSVMLNATNDIIDHELQGTPTNINVYKRTEIERRGKILGLGVVSTTRTEVEPVEQITHNIERILALFGRGIIVKPDCGLGGLLGQPSAYESSIQKLRNLVQAKRKIQKGI